MPGAPHPDFRTCDSRSQLVPTNSVEPSSDLMWDPKPFLGNSTYFVISTGAKRSGEICGYVPRCSCVDEAFAVPLRVEAPAFMQGEERFSMMCFSAGIAKSRTKRAAEKLQALEAYGPQAVHKC